MRPNTNILKQLFAREALPYTGLYVGFVAVLLGLLWVLFLPQTVAFSFATPTTCTTSPKLLPSLFKAQSNSFAVERPKSFSVAGFPLYSHKVCVTPKAAPAERRTYTARESILGIPGIGKPVRTATLGYARLSPMAMRGQAVPVDKPLRFKLDKPDTTFTYAVKANDKSSTCQPTGHGLACDISKLGLAHDNTYDIVVARTFGNTHVGEAISQTTKTLTPVTVVRSSISPGSLVYEQPSQLTLETDKPIKQTPAVKLVNKDAASAESIVGTKVEAKDTTLTVSFVKPLPRKVNFELQLDKLTATDESGLPEPYRLNFTTSGGPKVTSTNIGKSSVSPSQTITVQFDQQLAADQSWGKLVSLKLNGQAFPAAISASGSRLTINPNSDMPLCGAITISLTGDVQSSHLVSGDSAWSYTSRVRCSTIFSLGTSVGGRAITAYRFGSGANPIVYIGTIHGNEKSAKTLMDSWLAELEANPAQIPAGRSIVVVPVTNPDGYASSQRTNANNVDLNRNFPSNNWKSAVTVPGGTLLHNGGGTVALSEPESQALASFVQQERPRVLLTFHAKASIIEANEAGDSMAIANLYAKTSRYRAIAKSQNTIFNYDTTGALEDWMKDKLGLPALCIELASHSGNEFSRNKAALWAIAKL